MEEASSGYNSMGAFNKMCETLHLNPCLTNFGLTSAS